MMNIQPKRLVTLFVSAQLTVYVYVDVDVLCCTVTPANTTLSLFSLQFVCLFVCLTALITSLSRAYVSSNWRDLSSPSPPPHLSPPYPPFSRRSLFYNVTFYCNTLTIIGYYKYCTIIGTNTRSSVKSRPRLLRKQSSLSRFSCLVLTRASQ